MYVLKGFINHALLQNNTPGQVAVIGEASTDALTYSREKGYYAHASAPDQTLITFLSAVDGAAQKIDSQLLPLVMAIANFVSNKIVTGSGQMFADQLLLDLTNAFPDTATGFQSGEIKTDGTHWGPEWISWTGVAPAGYTGPDLTNSRFKLWFVDASFRSQYDEYEIVIVPPVSDLEQFFQAGSAVETSLKSRTLTQTMDAIQQAKGGYPETIVRADSYNWIDPMNTSHVVASQWGLLIYGISGNNDDIIKDSLKAYILAHSSHTEAEWTAILPDIFKRTEFILIPAWKNYAIPNMNLQAGIYSPVVGLTNSLNLIKQTVPSYLASHIDTNAAAFEYPYKSISILAIGGAENRDGLFKFTDVFPDYIAVASTSLDFNRMSAATKDFALLLEQMLLTAESMGDFTDIPLGMTKTVRDGILYLVKNYNNIHYLVAAKKSFPIT